MKKIVINGEQIGRIQDVYSTFSEADLLPEWFGRNLDALYDSLSDVFEEMEITVTGESALFHALGKKYGLFMSLLARIDEEKTNIRFIRQ